MAAFRYQILEGKASGTMSINAVSWPRKSLRATLCEIERGLFYVTYPDMDLTVDAAELSTYQVCASAAEAKRQVEQNAHALGFETVLWNDANSAPLFPTDYLRSIAEAPTATHAARPRI
jgi:hypothetical protein